MPQFFHLQLIVPSDPAAGWFRTLSRSDIMHLVDSQGTPIYLPPCLRWWAIERHAPENEFQAEYGPHVDDDFPKHSYKAKAL